MSIAIALLISSCDGDSPSSRPFPKRLVLNNPDATFIAKAMTGDRSAVEGNDALFELLPNGTVQPVEFLDDTGNVVDVVVEGQRWLDDEHQALEIRIYGSLYWLVMDLVTGDLYDLSDYGYSSMSILNGMLYAVDHRTVYRIDLSDLTATPMNNPDFNPYSSAGPLSHLTTALIVTAGGWVHINTTGGIDQMLAPDDSPPVASWIENVVYLGPTHMPCTILSKDGHFYKLGVEGSGSVAAPTQVLVGTIDATYNPLPVIHENTAGYGPEEYVARMIRQPYNETERYYIVRDGYVVISSTPSGALEFRWIDKDFSFLGDDIYQPTMPAKALIGNRLYWENGGVVMVADIVNDTAGTVLVDEPTMIRWEVVGNDVVYSKWISGTEAETYKVAVDGTHALLESSDMEIRHIVHFVLPEPPPEP